MKIEQFFNDNLVEQVELLADEEAGEFFKGVMHYVVAAEPFKTDNRMLKVMFSLFKANYDRQAKRNEDISAKRTEAIKKRWERANDDTNAIQTDTNGYKTIQMNTNVSGNADKEGVTQNARENAPVIQNDTNVYRSADTQQLTLFDEPETKIVCDKIQDNNIINNNINNNNNNRDSIEVVGDKEEEKEEEEVKKKEEKKKEKALELARRQENLEKRKQEFYQSLIPFCDLYPREMLRDFFEYWSELNRSKTQMRYEQQKTWETSKRLATWARRAESKPTDSNGINRTTISQEEAARQRAEEAARAINAVITTPKRDYEAEGEYIKSLFRQGGKGS